MSAAADPVGAVLDAHRAGRSLALRTSGTSGRPRAVVRTTASWFDSFPAVAELLHLSPGSRVWLPGPLAATMNLFAAVHAAHLGASVTVTPDRVTHAVVTPAALARALQQGIDLTGVHVLVAGDRLGRSWHDRALGSGVASVGHYYGAAELSFVAWGSHEDDLHPFPGVTVVERDGELWVRSPYLCLGYDGAPGPLRRDTDGFASVGDRGTVEHGRVRVTGRAEDTVVTGGATVLVTDVEAALEPALAGDAAARLAVVGLPHADLGEVLCALVTDRHAIPRLRAHARDALRPSHRPRRWVAVAELPLTSSGKLDRPRLAAAAAATGARSVDAR